MEPIRQSHERQPLPRRVVSISVPDDVLAQVEQSRGQQTRSAFVLRAIVQHLESLAGSEGRPVG